MPRSLTRLISLGLVAAAAPFSAHATVPAVRLEYSYALDMYCPARVEPEPLSESQRELIARIPVYRPELIAALPAFQAAWDQQGKPLLMQARKRVGKPFPMRELQAALFLCPRFPFMGTPLAFNVISYLPTPAKDIPALAGQPLPIFFFVSTAFHEVLHKYIHALLAVKPSAVLAALDESALYEAHLHLFALQKDVFTSLGLAKLLPEIAKLEALHGPDYVRAWQAVHASPELERALLAELRK